LDYLVPFVDFVFRLSLSRFTRPIETYSGNPPPLFLTVNMNDDRISDRIAFGSCNEQDLQNNLWPIIESRQPTAFVWGGDAIYAGTFAVLCRLGENLGRFYVWYRFLLASYIFSFCFITVFQTPCWHQTGLPFHRKRNIDAPLLPCCGSFTKYNEMCLPIGAYCAKI
jgi:hypothetical protein